MDLTQLANLGDFLGGVGVIASLIYLAREIHSGTKAAHNTAYHEAVTQLLSGCHELMSDRWNGLYERPSEELNDVEQFQVNYPVAVILFGTETLFHLNEQGHIDSRIWQNVEQNFYPMLQLTFLQNALKNRSGPLSRDLHKAVSRSVLDSASFHFGKSNSG